MFYGGEKVIFRINYKHFSRIRGIGENGFFLGEHDLTKESAAAFAGWFEENGFPDFQKAIAEQQAALRANQERARRVAAMFPKEIEPLIPEYAHVEKPWEHREKQERIISRILSKAANQKQILRVCWRAIGSEYTEWRAYNSVNYEPLSTICGLIETTTPAQQTEALECANDDDPTMLGGAYWSLREGFMSPQKLSDSALAKICAFRLRDQSDGIPHDMPQLLRGARGEKCLALRLEIAKKGIPRPTPTAISRNPLPDENNVISPPALLLLDSWLELLVDLADEGVPEARHIVLEKLKNAPEGLEKMALEAALACYDGPAHLRKEHFTIEQSDIERLLKNLKANFQK